MTIVVLVIALVIALAAAGFFWLKKKRDSKVEDEMRSDINHVYGTYEVSGDPVAEVKNI